MGTEFDRGQQAPYPPPPLDQQPAPGPALQPPRSVKRARNLLYVQGALGVLGGIVGLFLLLAGAAVGGAQGAVLLVIGGLTLVLGAALSVISFVLAAKVKTRQPGVRTAILVLQSILLALQVLNIVSVAVQVVTGGGLAGVGPALVGLAIVLGILVPIAGEESRAWFLSAA